MAVKITCLKKDGGNQENFYTTISSLGWVNESSGQTGHTSRDEMHDWINEGGKAYVRDSWGNPAYLTTGISERGTKFVRTKPDEDKEENLLNLGDCMTL